MKLDFTNAWWDMEVLRLKSFHDKSKKTPTLEGIQWLLLYGLTQLASSASWDLSWEKTFASISKELSALLSSI